MPPNINMTKMTRTAILTLPTPNILDVETVASSTTCEKHCAITLFPSKEG